MIKVAVIRGGPSYGYDASLKTGAYVLSLLYELPEVYAPLDIFISRDGEWHYGGLVQEPHLALHEADVVWNALHGAYGEDGQVQRILKNLHLPFTGPGAIPASLSHNKDMAKVLYRRHSLLTPDSRLIIEKDFNDDKLIAVFRHFLPPIIVKPADGIHALGVRLARTFQELKDAVKDTFKHSKKALVEEFISGHEVSCAVVENAKGEKLYSFVPIGSLNYKENQQIADMAKSAHEMLGLRHYSSSDFIITPKGRIYILETNSLPVFHEESLLRQSLLSTGWKPKDFAEHCINLALNKVS
ncbi:MAG: ATP-grasp domain-containing protein [Patescibacteria group bacterium]